MKCLQADERLGSVLAPLYRIRSSDGENSTHFLTSVQNVFDWIIKRLTCSIFSFSKCINNISFFNSECEIVLTVYLRFTVIIFCYIIRRSKWETSIIIFYSRYHYLSIPKVHPILLILMEVPIGKLDKCTFYIFCKWDTFGAIINYIAKCTRFCITVSELFIITQWWLLSLDNRKKWWCIKMCCTLSYM